MPGPLAQPLAIEKMKHFHILIIIFISITVLSCKNDKPETISATAAGTRNASGEIVVREATQEEINSLDKGIEQIQKVNRKYPAPPTPLNQETFAVISISEEGVFNLENSFHLDSKIPGCYQPRPDQ